LTWQHKQTITETFFMYQTQKTWGNKLCTPVLLYVPSEIHISTISITNLASNFLSHQSKNLNPDSTGLCYCFMSRNYDSYAVLTKELNWTRCDFTGLVRSLLGKCISGQYGWLLLQHQTEECICVEHLYVILGVR
jgi:hypothetical protein